MGSAVKNAPLTFKMAYWYGMGFAGCYLLYGGVNIILGILDRNYSNMGSPIFFAILGLVIFAVVLGFQETRKWGWYGLIVIYSLAIISGIITHTDYLDYMIIILSAAAMYFLTAEPTRRYLQASH